MTMVALDDEVTDDIVRGLGAGDSAKHRVQASRQLHYILISLCTANALHK